MIKRNYSWLTFAGNWLKFVGALMFFGSIVTAGLIIVGAFLGSNANTLFVNIGIGIGTFFSGATTGIILLASSDAISAFIDLTHSAQETAMWLRQRADLGK